MPSSGEEHLPTVGESLSSSVPQSAMDVVPIEIAVLDTTGDIVLVNAAWREFAAANHGRHPTHWVGENYLEHSRPGSDSDTDATIVPDLQGVLAGDREAFSTEYPCHSPERERWYKLDARAFDHDGERYCFVSHTNITEQKLAQLRAESRMAQLETLVAVLSHDLRNPLNVIQGYAQMLAEDLDGDARIDTILQAGTRIAEITEATLEFTQAGALSDTEPVDLTDLARTAWRTVDTGTATIESGETIQFHGDRKLLLQLFENLFRNAIEHAGADCTVRVGTIEDGFYVEDDGPGIADAIVESVLEADFSTQGSGGLGLPIVQAITDAHGCTLEICRGADGGARFEIRGVEPTPEPLE